jgi:cytochrome oxidase Cu insertion factor (SCO1/SenC/PrrC family)
MRRLTAALGSLLLLAVLPLATAQAPKSKEGNLKPGDVAPDFALKQLDNGKTIKLSELRGKPVVLVFGSCT